MSANPELDSSHLRINDSLTSSKLPDSISSQSWFKPAGCLIHVTRNTTELKGQRNSIKIQDLIRSFGSRYQNPMAPSLVEIEITQQQSQYYSNRLISYCCLSISNSFQSCYQRYDDFMEKIASYIPPYNDGIVDRMREQNMKKKILQDEDLLKSYDNARQVQQKQQQFFKYKVADTDTELDNIKCHNLFESSLDSYPHLDNASVSDSDSEFNLISPWITNILNPSISSLIILDKNGDKFWKCQKRLFDNFTRAFDSSAKCDDTTVIREELKKMMDRD